LLQLKSAAVQHDSEITKLLQKHRDEVAYITETAKSKVKQIHDEHGLALAQKQDQIRELEESMRKIQLQIAVQDSYWRKKEHQLADAAKQQVLIIDIIFRLIMAILYSG
jgi:galactitol-specific phosphotransferase system IIB component